MTTFLYKIARSGPAGTTTEVPSFEPEVTKESLVDLVLQVVAQADWTQPGVDGRLGRNRTPRGEVLLATLTYCYASGLYNSGHIESAILRNKNNAGLLDRMPLNRRSFSQFRRYHRDLLKACLTQVLSRMGHADQADHRIDRAVESDFIECDE